MQQQHFTLSLVAIVLSVFGYILPAQALEQAVPISAITARYFNGPTVTSVTSNGAQVSLSSNVLSEMSPEEKSQVYFSYIETRKVCIMIYPTPKECLPKTTEKGKLTVMLTDLKPDTEYMVTYKRDSTIQCITTPCPGNEFESLSAIFTTKKANTENWGQVKKTFAKNLRLGNRGEDVSMLQEILIQKGYLTGKPTGYFGQLTERGVRKYQQEHHIQATGLVGVLTRAKLNAIKDDKQEENVVTETFEGIVTAVSTGCFADGECSITVDNKKVVTTIGWSQGIVGKILGVPSIGDVEKHIGSRAKVFAKKVEGGYSLYGNSSYYIEIFPAVISLSKPSSLMSFFITHKNPGKGADLGGLEGADAYCSTLATEAGVTGKTWKAYLSTTKVQGVGGVHARERIGNGPWYNYKGELIAMNLADLHGNNNITKQTALTNTGEIVFGRGDGVNVHDIMTGSDSLGMYVATTTDTTCSNWTSSDVGSAYVGHHDRIGINDSAAMKSWNSSHLSRGCSLGALRSSGGGGLIYCFAK